MNKFTSENYLNNIFSNQMVKQFLSDTNIQNVKIQTFIKQPLKVNENKTESSFDSSENKENESNSIDDEIGPMKLKKLNLDIGDDNFKSINIEEPDSLKMRLWPTDDVEDEIQKLITRLSNGKHDEKFKNCLTIYPLDDNVFICYLHYKNNQNEHLLDFQHADISGNKISHLIPVFEQLNGCTIKDIRGYSKLSISEEHNNSNNTAIIKCSWQDEKSTLKDLNFLEIPVFSKALVFIKTEICSYETEFLANIKMLQNLLNNKLYKFNNLTSKILAEKIQESSVSKNFDQLDIFDKLWLKCFDLTSINQVKKVIHNVIKQASIKIDSTWRVRIEEETDMAGMECESIFVSFISDAIKSGKPLSKTMKRSLITTDNLDEALKHLIDVGFRFLNYYLRNSELYKIICNTIPAEDNLDYLDYQFVKNYNQEIYRLQSIKSKNSTPKAKPLSDQSDYTIDEITSTCEPSWEQEMNGKIYALFYNILVVHFVNYFILELGFSKDQLANYFQNVVIENLDSGKPTVLLNLGTDDSSFQVFMLPDKITYSMMAKQEGKSSLLGDSKISLLEWQFSLLSDNENGAYATYNFLKDEKINFEIEKGFNIENYKKSQIWGYKLEK